MNDFHPDHPDLDALLSTTPPDEAVRLREVWALVGPDEPAPAPAPRVSEVAFRRFEAALDAPPRPGRPPRTSPRAVRRRAVLRWGVGVAAVVLVGALGLFWWMQPVTHMAPPGQRLPLTLPDGSFAELNSGATLQHARHFGAERRVQLRGEAFFAVEDAAAPFVVETFDAEVAVLGTRFSVRAWPGGLEPGTTVALESGSVRLAPRAHPERAVTMAPGETRRLVAGTPLAPEALSVEEATAWRRGDFIFKDASLGVMLDELERRFVREVVVHPEVLRQKRLNVTLRQPEGLDAIVHTLALACGLRYRETAAGFELFEE